MKPQEKEKKPTNQASLRQRGLCLVLVALCLGATATCASTDPRVDVGSSDLNEAQLKAQLLDIKEIPNINDEEIAAMQEMLLEAKIWKSNAKENAISENIFEKLKPSLLDPPDCNPENSRLRNVLRVLALVYKLHATRWDSESKNTDNYKNNWDHTMRELGALADVMALDVSLSGKSDSKVHRRYLAYLGAVFTDAMKVPLSSALLSKGNFLDHNRYGAAAAEHVLKTLEYRGVKSTARYLQDADIIHVRNAIQEHQVSPPLLMSRLARQAASSDASIAILNSIVTRISNPLEGQMSSEENGSLFLEFTSEEVAVFNGMFPNGSGSEYPFGAPRWYTPGSPANGTNPTPWFDVSRVLIASDGNDNYTTCGGLKKILDLRGPGGQPYFKDATLSVSVQSVLGKNSDDVSGSYAQYYSLLKDLYGGDNSNEVVQKAESNYNNLSNYWNPNYVNMGDNNQGLLQKDLEQWIVNQGRSVDSYPFWKIELSDDDYSNKSPAFKKGKRLRDKAIELLNSYIKKGWC